MEKVVDRVLGMVRQAKNRTNNTPTPMWKRWSDPAAASSETLCFAYVAELFPLSIAGGVRRTELASNWKFFPGRVRLAYKKAI